MKKNNKGFSLVELIIVIAIMAVLVGVLAPQFIKYVEQSRRGKDIQNADMIKEAIQADIADGVCTNDQSTAVTVTISAGSTYSSTVCNPSSISSQPSATGKDASGYSATWDHAAGTVNVYITGSGTGFPYDVTTETGAASYKNR